MRGERVEHGGLLAPLVRSPGQRDSHRKAGHALRQVVKEAQRGPVDPVGVVHGDDEGRTLGQVGGQPVQPVHERERLVLLLQRPGAGSRLEQLVGQRRGVRGEQLAFLVLGAGQAGFEQLERCAEREVALELAPARGEDVHPRAAGEPARGRHELRLAEAGMSLDDQQAAASVACGIEHRADGVELDVALQQRCRCDRRIEPFACHAPALLSGGRPRT